MTTRVLPVLFAALLASSLDLAGPIDPDEALSIYYLDGLTFPAVEQDRGQFTPPPSWITW